MAENNEQPDFTKFQLDPDDLDPEELEFLKQNEQWLEREAELRHLERMRQLRMWPFN